jgi:hypothetical protein
MALEKRMVYICWPCERYHVVTSNCPQCGKTLHKEPRWICSVCGGSCPGHWMHSTKCYKCGGVSDG